MGIVNDLGENMINIDSLLKDFRKKLNLNGRVKVLDEGNELTSEYIEEEADPEPFTKKFLIEPIIKSFNLEQIPEKHFSWSKVRKKVDYRLKNNKNILFLLEAKPLNANLYKKESDGAVNQIKEYFKLAEVKENYKFGIATDGLKWIFINRESEIKAEYNINRNIEDIKKILTDDFEIAISKQEEEISKKFYDWYNAILYGGKYRNHLNKSKNISEKDCLIRNIFDVASEIEKEQIAQILMNRLIFIKFLQSKEIVNFDVLEYLSKLPEDSLNAKLKQLFFHVFNKKPEARFDIDKKFHDIPYLNGSLFDLIKAESNNDNYKIKSDILKEILNFLDSFNFIHYESDSNKQIIDPEILGYIFERAMTAENRKGTGAYYTPKYITKYIARSTINSIITKKVNILLSKMDYKENELISDFEQIFILKETTLQKIYNDIILNIKICDNACGSGAFLLAAADILIYIYKRVNQILHSKDSEIAMRRLILKNNLYGVDINSNAIEITKLRLWLWIASIFKADKVKPLPNIDYKLRAGNSLIGFIDIAKFKEQQVTLDRFFEDQSFKELIEKREVLKLKYNDSNGEDNQNLRREIEAIDQKIRITLFDSNLYEEMKNKIQISEKEYFNLLPFHWGFDFYSVFNLDNKTLSGGFDIIIGNPPYFKVLKNNPINIMEDFQEIKSGMMNVSSIFVNRSLKLIQNNGCIGMIIPKMLAYTKSWDKLRRKVLMRYTIEKVIDCRRAFKDVKLEQIIIIVSNRIPSKKHNIIIGDLNNFMINETAEVSQNLCVSENSLYLECDPNAYTIKSKMEESGNFLGNYADIKLGPGIQGRKDIFGNKRTNGYHKVYRGDDIQRYYIRDSMYYKPNNPQLDEYRNIILSFRRQHIAVQRIIAHIRDHIKITAALDLEGNLSFNTVTNIFPIGKKYDIKYILAILNSNPVQYYTHKFIYQNAIRSMDFYKSYANRIPLPEVNKSEQNGVIEIVDKIIEFYNSDPKQRTDNESIIILEKKINNLLYSHYNLTKEQQLIIKNTMK